MNEDVPLVVVIPGKGKITIGAQYGHLTVLRCGSPIPATRSRKLDYLFKTLCACGQTSSIPGKYLLLGKQACGRCHLRMYPFPTWRTSYHGMY